MNKFSIAFLLFFLSVLITNAQQGNDMGSLSGTVKDEASGEPVDFAAVSVFKQGSEIIVRSFMTDNKGNFKFENIPYGVYKIKISFVGYQNIAVEGIVINKDNPDHQFKDIKLASDPNNLEAVVITESKPLIEFGADTITFNVDQSMMAEGSTASDVLKNVPMVDVDIDGKPTIAGKINTRIFIDGKPSDYTAESIADLLNILPSDAIQKIEVLTNPDVQYSADGDGIINIVLKKGYKIGLNGALSLTGGTAGTYNTNVYTAYSDKIISVNTSYGYKDSRSKSYISTFRTNYDVNENISGYRDQFSDGLTTAGGHNLRSSVNWDITPKQNLRFSANYNNSRSNGLGLLDDDVIRASGVRNYLRIQDMESGNKAANYSINADYTFDINKKQESLTAGFTLFNNGTFRDRDLNRLDHYDNGSTARDFNQRNENDITNSRFEVNVDYRKPITRLSSLSVGSQYTINNNSDHQFVWNRNPISQENIPDPVLTNNFDYQEQILAMYASYRLRTKTRWSFRAGVRAENTELTIKQAAEQVEEPNSYFNLFPNLSINKLYKKKYNFGLSYSMRISRPRSNTLNPLINNLNETNISFGNPNLSPSYTNQFQFSFGTYGLKWSFTPRISYSTTENVIERFRISQDSLTYGNLGSIQALTFSAFGNYRPTKKITLSGSYSLSRRAYQSKSEFLIDRVGNSHRAKLTTTAQFPYKISFEAHVNYANNAIAQGKTSGSVTTSFGVRKTFMKNKLLVRFLTTDPFEERNVTEFIDGITISRTGVATRYTQDRNRIINTRNYSVTVSYRFTNTKKKEKLDSAIKIIDKESEKKKAPAKKAPVKKVDAKPAVKTDTKK